MEDDMEARRRAMRMRGMADMLGGVERVLHFSPEDHPIHLELKGLKILMQDIVLQNPTLFVETPLQRRP